MRKLRRPAAPKVLQENGERWNARWTQLKTQNSSAKFQWYQHESRSVRNWIIDDLRAMTAGHCAFCDGFTVEPESVEHFRPKSDARFLQLAYSWGNLFFCCGGCQNHKLEKWDDELIDPTVEDFLFETYFEFDFTTGAIRPQALATAEATRKAEVTIRMYGLDSVERRRFRLLELRHWNRSSYPVLDDFAYRDFVASPPLDSTNA